MYHTLFLFSSTPSYHPTPLLNNPYHFSFFSFSVLMNKDIKLECRQISPVIGNNYKESSFPVGIFVWKITNTSTHTADVSIMFSFQNGTGSESDTQGGHVNRYQLFHPAIPLLSPLQLLCPLQVLCPPISASNY